LTKEQYLELLVLLNKIFAKIRKEGLISIEVEIRLHVIQIALVAFVGGAAPQMAAEFGRRAIPSSERSTFTELETAVRK
jgi:chemotaxis protein MotA